MPQNTTNFLQEAVAALRGLVGLASGNREARRWFDLTLRGLCGSFIALLLATAISDFVPVLRGRPGVMFENFTSDAITMALQWGCSAIVLRQVGRTDGFVPYLTADNWNTAYVTILVMVLGLLGVSPEFLWFPATVLVLLLAVNVGRLIVGLPGLQTAMLVIAQLVGLGVGVLITSLLFPIPPEALVQ